LKVVEITSVRKVPDGLSGEPAIVTSIIEIQVFKIGVGQITSSIIRKLREKTPASHDCKIGGMAWGIVNCHFDKCSGLDIRQKA
jgi:hypothetical protein